MTLNTKTNQEKAKLIALGYPSELATKYLNSRHRKSLPTLIEAHVSLISHFSHEKLINVASHVSGIKNLVAIKTHYHILHQWDFSEEDIIKMVSHRGGSKNLEAVKSYREALMECGYSKEDIIKMVSHGGGSKNLEAVKTNRETLMEFGFQKEDIIKMVSQSGGSKNLEAVKTNREALMEFGFSKEDIIKMVSHDGGSKILEAVIGNREALVEFGFSREDIIKMVSHNGGSKNLEGIKTNCESLMEFGFSKEDIIKMVSRHGGSKNLEAVKANRESLMEFGFSKEDIIKMVSHHGGSKILEAVKDNRVVLMEFGFSKEDIIKMVSQSGGSKNLEAVKTNREALMEFGFQKKDIIKMVSHDGGSKILEAVKANREVLMEFGFSKKDIIKMVSHGGGSKNLEAVKANREALVELGFSKEDIIQMVSQSGGSKNLEAVKAHLKSLMEFGFSKKDIIKLVKDSCGGSGRIAAVLHYAGELKARGFTNQLIIKAVCHLGRSSLHPEVTMENIHLQLALSKQLKRLRNNFFRHFEADRIQQLACYRHPDINKPFSAILDFAKTDSQVSTRQAFARLFARYMNNEYAIRKAEGTLEIDDNHFRVENDGQVSISAYGSFYEFLEGEDVVLPFSAHIEELPPFPPKLNSIPPMEGSFIDEWLEQELLETPHLTMEDDSPEINNLARQLQQELGDSSSSQITSMKRRQRVPSEEAKEPRSAKRQRRGDAAPPLSSCLIDALPQLTQLNGLQFTLEPELGLELQRRSKQQQQDMGIERVRKCHGKTLYIIKLGDLERYARFLACFGRKESALPLILPTPETPFMASPGLQNILDFNPTSLELECTEQMQGKQDDEIAHLEAELFAAPLPLLPNEEYEVRKLSRVIQQGHSMTFFQSGTKRQRVGTRDEETLERTVPST